MKNILSRLEALEKQASKNVMLVVWGKSEEDRGASIEKVMKERNIKSIDGYYILYLNLGRKI